MVQQHLKHFIYSSNFEAMLIVNSYSHQISKILSLYRRFTARLSSAVHSLAFSRREVISPTNKQKGVEL